MYRLCNSPKCRRKELLGYFGEHLNTMGCQACDNCIDDVEMIEGTIIAQKILSCVYRLDQRFGIKYVTDVLRGSKIQTIFARGHDSLSTYNLMPEFSEQDLRFYIDQLIHMGYLRISEGEYPLLQWTDTSRQVVNQSAPVKFKKKMFREVKKSNPFGANYDAVLFGKLRQLRMELAKRDNVPPFVVFSDRSLAEMAVHYPQSQNEFLLINGVGPAKWEKYGDDFLLAIQKYCEENAIAKRTPKPYREAPKAIRRGGSADETVRLFVEGRTLEEISRMRGLVKGTLFAHLVQYMEEGNDLDISTLVSKDRQDKILSVIQQVGSGKLLPIKEKLPEDYTYDEIRLVGAMMCNTKL
jgi:ATP-dependent DNA helicase RecQ